MNSFYSEDELNSLGLKEYGKNVLISRKASIYGNNTITLGDNIRVDDFCILSGNITMGNNIHIAAYSALFAGTAGITINDFANISSRVCIYAISDDFSGNSMTNPTIPDIYKCLINKPVFLGKHVVIGSGSTILPGVKLEEGTALGAMTLCKESTEPWGIYAGIPAKYIKNRSKNLLKLEEDYKNGKN